MATLTTGRLATGTVRLKTGMASSSYHLTTSLESIPAGKITATIYSLIRDNQFQTVIKLLQHQPKSRESLSLLGYCYYQIQDYHQSSDAYEQLIKIHDSEEYRLYYAQSLYKSGQYLPAQKVCQGLSTQNPRVVQLQASILYEMGEFMACKSIIDSFPDSADKLSDKACLLLKEEKVEEALETYLQAISITGFRPDLAYNTALCYYNLKEYVQSLTYLGQIIEHGVHEHPEMEVGMSGMKSVGNSQTLHKTFLIEAFNLKAAIEFNCKNYKEAKEALEDMPPRDEHELDPVTLHNQALIGMEKDPTGGFEKLGFLLDQEQFPPETFGNLLLLYTKYEFLDSAADLMAANGDLVSTLEPYVYDFVDAAVQKSTSPEESYKRFDNLGDMHIEVLRKLTRQVQDARDTRNDAELKKLLYEYDDEVNRYIPILMAQAKVFWDKNDYGMVEKIFKKSVEFCSDHETWKLNVAHVLFMQGGKYKEAISFYEPAVRKHFNGNILDVTAIVLANLCVSYIMVSQNEEAEDIMRRIEREEERVTIQDPTQRIFHLCIVNLVIGTLYCSKGNYEFGISRIMKSMEPFSKKLGTDTWFYSKRCFLALYENLAKQTLILQDSIFTEILDFFDACELNGRNIPVSLDPVIQGDTNESISTTVASEARMLKCMFLKLYQ